MYSLKKKENKNKADKEPKVAKTPNGQVCLLVLYLPKITKKKKRDEKKESTAMKTRETPSFPSSKKKAVSFFSLYFLFCEKRLLTSSMNLLSVHSPFA